MRSINSVNGLSSLLDRFEAAQGLLFASLDWLTVPELVTALERYEFLIGRLHALSYELSSPFARPSGRRT